MYVCMYVCMYACMYGSAWGVCMGERLRTVGLQVYVNCHRHVKGGGNFA